MEKMPVQFRSAQAEVHRTARDQDLIEVPKRAHLDRKAEGKTYQAPASTPDQKQHQNIVGIAVPARQLSV
jgi:hypothetical protein